MKTNPHIGFKAAAERIAQRLQGKGITSGEAKKRAGSILASSSRHASMRAKKANPRLKKIKGAC